MTGLLQSTYDPLFLVGIDLGEDGRTGGGVP